MNTNSKFITNADGKSLLTRFQELIGDARLFDVLVGYFYSSGFDSLASALKKTERIRIIVGISTDRATAEKIAIARQHTLPLSDAQIKKGFTDKVTTEMQDSLDTAEVEGGVRQFIDWLSSGKIQIRIIPERKIHAKVYIVTFNKGRDEGRVITGSSNFTRAGLVDNLEFNVELRDDADYKFAQEKFNELWEEAVDVSPDYCETVTQRTWLRQDIKPYHLYLKCLYEHFQADLAPPTTDSDEFIPDGYMELQYQTDAVHNAKRILQAYKGVFLSDVVGLGKTYIAARLIQTLGKPRTLVIAPPALIDERNPGSWRNVFHEFGILAHFESRGALRKLKDIKYKYDTVIIDEAHRFRNDTNETYEQLARICRNKNVILVTATPYNNRPTDILNQINLFQPAKNSNIPNIANLEAYFSRLNGRLKGISRDEDPDEYLRVIKDNARSIRQNVLKHLMVRRTRTEVARYYAQDLSARDINFPTIQNPVAIYYELSGREESIFDKTILLVAKSIKYARYKSLTYHTDPVQFSDYRQGQANLAGFMRILLIKRLESSFYAFRQTLDRFIKNHELFLEGINDGYVYISKKDSLKLFELLQNKDGGDAKIQQMIDDDRAHRYPINGFRPELKRDCEDDLNYLRKIKNLWNEIKRDPKLGAFIQQLESDTTLRENKLIIFTESKETAGYLTEKLKEADLGTVLEFHGSSTPAQRQTVIENFDLNITNQKDDYRILVTTDVLAEGVNLHRSNTVINYDIPWNPTQLMQRVGRVNRIGTQFDQLYIYNFFPTDQSDDQIHLKGIAQSKIQAFIALLGNDAKLLTNSEEIESHEIFERLNSKEAYTAEDEGELNSELKYFNIIRDVRDKDPELFNEIKALPRKARTAKTSDKTHNALITYFRKGPLEKFYLTEDGKPHELDFVSAAAILETAENTPPKHIPADFYEHLKMNKAAFHDATLEHVNQDLQAGSNQSNMMKLSRIIKALLANPQAALTDEQEQTLKQIRTRLQEGLIPFKTAKKAYTAAQQALTQTTHELQKVYSAIVSNIPSEFIAPHSITQNTAGAKHKVVLSEYLVKE